MFKNGLKNSKFKNSIKHDFNKTRNIYPSLNATVSNEQQLRLNKID